MDINDGAGKPIQHAADGAGPLLQRDYCGVIRDSKMTPEEIVRLVRTHFSTFAPKEMANFSTATEASGILDVGSEMKIDIRLAGVARVRVVQADDLSFTLRTLEGHPEAGRVTFGAQGD